MNVSYVRKSTFDRKTTSENVKTHAKKLGFTVVGETVLPAGNGVVIHLSHPTLVGNLIASDLNLLGLLPSAVAVVTRKDDVVVGVGSAAVLSGVSQNPAIAAIARDAEKACTDLVHAACGVGPMKPVSVKLYSTTTCPYCKMEASWFDENKVAYTQVHVDQNQAEAEQMVRKTGQMGVPVTEVTYEDGQEEYVVGFDRDRLSGILSLR